MKSSNSFPSPGTPKSPEARAEKVPTREEILAIIMPYIEGPHTVVKERANTGGIYLLEVRVEESTPGYATEYSYSRKGRHGREHGHQNEFSDTQIDAVFYIGDMPVGSDTIANFDFETGIWKTVSGPKEKEKE